MSNSECCVEQETCACHLYGSARMPERLRNSFRAISFGLEKDVSKNQELPESRPNVLDEDSLYTCISEELDSNSRTSRTIMPTKISRLIEMKAKVGSTSPRSYKESSLPGQLKKLFMLFCFAIFASRKGMRTLQCTLCRAIICTSTLQQGLMPVTPPRVPYGPGDAHFHALQSTFDEKRFEFGILSLLECRN